jgi:hypothetical protein
MRSLLSQTGEDPHSTYSIYRLLQTLGLAIKQAMFKRKEALLLLKDVWKLLAKKGYEQLLIPFGVALARSHVSKTNVKLAVFCFIFYIRRSHLPGGIHPAVCFLYRFEYFSIGFAQRPILLPLMKH